LDKIKFRATNIESTVASAKTRVLSLSPHDRDDFASTFGDQYDFLHISSKESNIDHFGLIKDMT
jgi:hypothetical protein